MKKLLVVGVISLFLVLTVSPSTGFNLEKQPTVSSLDGKTLYVGGSGPNNYSIIQDAIDDANDGDTVFVYDDSSPYYEINVHVNKEIDLVGEDKNTTAIIGDSYGTNNVIKITADHATLSGFTIQKSGGGATNVLSMTKAGVYNTHANNTEIFNNIIENNMGEGICLRTSHHCIVRDNIIRKNKKRGLLVFSGCTDAFITGNTIRNNSIDNVHVLNGDGITITGNNILYEMIILTNVFNSKVTKNNIYRPNNAIAAKFTFTGSTGAMDPFGAYLSYLGVRWKGRTLKFNNNYWWKSRFFRHLIQGNVELQGPFTWAVWNYGMIKYDKNPVYKPYEIPGWDVVNIPYEALGNIEYE
jgi:parallel beta-helix repeat protein